MTDAAERYPVEIEAQADYREWLAEYDADHQPILGDLLADPSASGQMRDPALGFVEFAAEFNAAAADLADRFEAHINDPRSTQ